MRTLTQNQYNKELKDLNKIQKKLSFAEYNKRRSKLDRERSNTKAIEQQELEPKKRKELAKYKTVDIAKFKAREFMYDVIGGADALERLVLKIFQQALKGSFKHQELIMNYLLGKPLDRIKLDASGVTPSTVRPVVKILADHLRLEKLNKDFQAVEVDPDRIKEMEDLLNKEINEPLSDKL